MKRNRILIGIVAIGLLMTGCGPIVTSGPDVSIGGGIYPAPFLVPPIGPGAYRPGGPNGPGFIHAVPGGNNRPTFSPNGQGRPNRLPGVQPNPGNQRVPGIGPGGAMNPVPNNPGRNPVNPGLNNPIPKNPTQKF